LWSAIVALLEGAEFARRLADRHPALSKRLLEQAEEKERQANIIRGMITDGGNRIVAEAD
jgi:hypothetical protein